MFSVVNVYIDHLKFCVVCINGRRYVRCGECYVVSNGCDESTSLSSSQTTSRDAKPTQTYRNHTSKQRQFRPGVPQGGLLSPTLFNIYTSDLPPTSAPVQVMAYADDIKSQPHKYECSQEIHTTIPT